MTRHPEWETLNDLADAVLGEEERAEVEAHVAVCAMCRTTLERLREVSAAAHAMPRDVAPPPLLWASVRRSIERGNVNAGGEARDILHHAADGPPVRAEDRARPPEHVAGAIPPGYRAGAIPERRPGGAVLVERPGGTIPPRRGARAIPIARAWLAAAALFLVVASSAITFLVTNGRNAPVSVARSIDVGTASAPGVPASVQSAEEGLLASVQELEAFFERQRPALAPSTVRVVDRSLATINEAIEEARAALLADPANQELARLLAASYRQKVELLRRAAELQQAS